MDQLRVYAPGNAEERSGEPRSFLFLQGPISDFFDRLGRTLIGRGHQVHRVNLHFGDRLFWRLPATDFRGRFADWRRFVGAILDQHRITDLVLHGDRRPYHIVAAEEARARGIRVIATDLGYVRPDWITLEYDGMTTYSRFPRDPAAIRALAARLPEPDLEPRFRNPFWLISVLDVLYNLGLVFGRPLYPSYRYHSIVHPFVEYAGWLWSRGLRAYTKGAASAEKHRLAAAPGSYFLVPLQLSTDYQIRAHSRFRELREAVREIVSSFAASGSRRELVFVVHPLDNGLINWPRFVAGLARDCGAAGQIYALPGGTPPELLCGAAGVVTVNSTVGVTALQNGVPVKTLGNAVFDIAGLTCQAPLASFWHDPPKPDPTLMQAFLRALVGTTQVKGGYYTRTSQACAIAGFVERLEGGLYPLAAPAPDELARRAPRSASRRVFVDASAPLGVAVARAYARPGVALRLTGGDEAELARTAEDCRRRGAQIEPIDAFGAVDRLIVCGGSGANSAEPLAPFATVVAGMRRHRRGEIVLVGDFGDRATAAVLRRRWQADGVALSLVRSRGTAPDRLAPRIAATDIEAGMGGIANRLMQVLRAARARLGEVLRLPGVPAPADEAPVPGKSGLGD